MANVRVEIAGKNHLVGCDDGGEDHLVQLAARVDAKARLIAPQPGAPGDGRLFLLAALMIADELDAAQRDLVKADARLAALRRDYKRLETRAAEALETAAARLDAMAVEDVASLPVAPLLLTPPPPTGLVEEASDP
jgi:cell division protein ZapA